MPLWQRVSELPDLHNAGLIAIDVETKDDGLRSDRGSAWPWRGGHIAGVSVAWRVDARRMRIISRYATPTPIISAPNKSLDGCAIW